MWSARRNDTTITERDTLDALPLVVLPLELGAHGVSSAPFTYRRTQRRSNGFLSHGCECSQNQSESGSLPDGKQLPHARNCFAHSGS